MSEVSLKFLNFDLCDDEHFFLNFENEPFCKQPLHMSQINQCRLRPSSQLRKEKPYSCLKNAKHNFYLPNTNVQIKNRLFITGTSL